MSAIDCPDHVALAEALVSGTVGVMHDLAHHHAPGLDPPRLLAGHIVDDAAVADLVFTLGLLHRLGVDAIDDVPIIPHVRRLIAGLDAGMVEAFASYRVGETAIALGALSDDDPWPDDELDHVRRCVDTSNTIGAVREGRMPPNYAVVVARCLKAGATLADEPAGEWPEFLDRAGELFDTPTGWIDDGPGDLRHYDIYSPDMYLFAEPIADELGRCWVEGLGALLIDLDDLVDPGGTIVWGRSIGALGLAMTVELTALGRRHGLIADISTWLDRADQAQRTLLADWFGDGLISAHKHRSTMFYRGPERRLQMTLDILGKLASATLDLRSGDTVDHGGASGPTWGEVDRLIRFEEGDAASVWAHRGPHLRLALPVMHGWASDYLPTPRAPGVLEVPTSGHPCLIPVLWKGDNPLVPAGLARSVEHDGDALTIDHDGWAPVGQDADGPDAHPGSRSARYRVDGRTLSVEEHLTVADPAGLGPLSLSIAETSDRPLAVTAETVHDDGSASPLAVRAVDTAGIAEWRSFWSSLDRVHQVELPLGRSVRCRWSVTPQLVIADTIAGHEYSAELYRPLRERVVHRPAPTPDADFARHLAGVDVFHLAWPEWWSGVDPDWTQHVIDAVHRAGVAIVWTQHNLAPHADKSDAARTCYQLWAAAADAVIHHSAHGRDVAMDTYRYGAHTRHEVIAHGHWGRRHSDHPFKSRELAEIENDWPSCGIRLGVVGSPRDEKDLQSVLDGFAATDRDDLQLVIRVGTDNRVPDDPRIIAERTMTEEGLYVRRLAGLDALILPFADHGMLTTGTAFDAIGAGLAAITSDWSFFDETFDGADIRYGWGADELAICLQALTREQIEASTEAVEARRTSFEWHDSADRMVALFDQVVDAR